MKKTILATTILAFTAAPALAQSGNTGSDAANTNQSNMSDQSTTSGQGTGGQAAITTEDMVASQKKVLDALKTAGYEDASIMDAAYLVQATTPDGERVVMMIDTSGRVMGAQRQGGQGSQSGQPGTSGQSGQSGQSESNASSGNGSDDDTNDGSDSDTSSQ
ncbi:hypothetical protein [Aurantimonas sp. 22II-16-19i]|uniref:hypothetical protein n=1 Tax=Aurantimonas sp. 22II-16-19i TaxID=1317114 RepID=UPI0009F7B6CC|nr:hypothetical protein [Aurantimonas sp. 22II-16-19i]ORE98238.1 hypothetical protein ATO4_04622 [Aurantimonas sp. 22II-16-19i]